MDLATWLRRRRPDRIVCQPGDHSWPRPVSRPWVQLVELAGQADAVLAYRGQELLGVWRRPAAVQADPMPGHPVGGGNAGHQLAGRAAESYLAAELGGLRDLVKFQTAMLREVISAQGAALKAVRAAGRYGPDRDEDERDEDGGGDELDAALRAALAPAMPAGFDLAALSTADVVKMVLSRKHGS